MVVAHDGSFVNATHTGLWLTLLLFAYIISTIVEETHLGNTDGTLNLKLCSAVPLKVDCL